MIRNYLFIITICVFYSCKQKNSKTGIVKPSININFDDSKYVKIDSFKKGDVRRYGIFPNQPINESAFNKVIELADKGLPITFPKGKYDTNISIKGLKDVALNFNDAIITGSIYIIEKDTVHSERIQLNGNLKLLDKLFIRKSNDISFDNITVCSDTLNNIFKKKNRGVSIYAGSKFISFSKLRIENTGGTKDSFYSFSASALQIHGFNNNPEYIKIKNLQIINSDRTALYLTGENHEFNKVSITNFGLGSSKNMFGLEDAKPGTEKEFTGAWLNKCNNVIIDSLEISQNYRKGTNSIRLDEGKYHEPTFINNIKLSGYTQQLNIADHKLTNILVKDEYE